ncbi:RES family NAD+ phosphorylase [Mycolicibacter engbaekii]|uniref:RES family NAD+ phosphorylase n=1 Tax=Mycolicibacter engbaekii TaxID=188915 RepID=UPI001A99B63B|nr:RES family NAD+ phosphorylase [Mycolicibacter engbaekii]
MPELPAGYRIPLPESRPAGLRRRRITAGTQLWRLDADHPDQWDWTGFAEPRHRFDPPSARFRTRYAATDLIGAFRERYRLTGLLVPGDHAGHHLVRLSANRHLRVLDLRTERNLDALGVDDQISTGQHDAVWTTCQQLADAVRRWWPQPDECPDAIVYRSRTTPETSVNYAFFAGAAFDIEAWPLQQRPDVTADLVLRHGFTVGY